MEKLVSGRSGGLLAGPPLESLWQCVPGFINGIDKLPLTRRTQQQRLPAFPPMPLCSLPVCAQWPLLSGKRWASLALVKVEHHRSCQVNSQTTGIHEPGMPGSLGVLPKPEGQGNRKRVRGYIIVHHVLMLNDLPPDLIFWWPFHLS